MEFYKSNKYIKINFSFCPTNLMDLLDILEDSLTRFSYFDLKSGKVKRCYTLKFSKIYQKYEIPAKFLVFSS